MDYQSDTTADGTSVFSPATWASETQEDLGFADQTLGFFKGAYDVGKDAVIGTAELAYDVAATGYDSILGAPYKAVDIFKFRQPSEIARGIAEGVQNSVST